MFDLSGFDDTTFDNSEALAIQLSKQSKETFWLEHSSTPRCHLEKFAKAIMNQHTQGMNIGDLSSDRNDKNKHKDGKVGGRENGIDTMSTLGCEWWVQVKELNEKSSEKLCNKEKIPCGDEIFDHDHNLNLNHIHSGDCSHGKSGNKLTGNDSLSQSVSPPLIHSSGVADHSHIHDHGHDHSHSEKACSHAKSRRSIVKCADDCLHAHGASMHHDDDDSGGDNGDSDDDDVMVGGIGLHYDKDEEIAETFGIGVFPQLSTVTYLSSSNKVAPTIVIENTPSDPIGKSIRKCYASYPIRGKHVRFDGRYLHGACPQFCVENDDTDEDVIENVEKNSEDVHIPPANLKGSGDGETNFEGKMSVADSIKYRVTFLVNIWVNHKPLKVEMMPTSICDEQIAFESELGLDNVQYSNIFADNAPKICTVSVTKKIVSNEEYGDWQDVPFVTEESDWGKDDDEKELFLRIWTPFRFYLQICAKKMIDNRNAMKNSNSKDKKKKLTLKLNSTADLGSANDELDSITTFVFNYTDEESHAFLLYDDDDDDECGEEGCDDDECCPVREDIADA